MKISEKAAARKATFQQIAEIRAYRDQPSAFNPHYQPKPTPLNDRALACKGDGPRMCTIQLESTIRRNGH